MPMFFWSTIFCKQMPGRKNQIWKWQNQHSRRFQWSPSTWIWCGSARHRGNLRCPPVDTHAHWGRSRISWAGSPWRSLQRNEKANKGNSTIWKGKQNVQQNENLDGRKTYVKKWLCDIILNMFIEEDKRILTPGRYSRKYKKLQKFMK